LTGAWPRPIEPCNSLRLLFGERTAEVGPAAARSLAARIRATLATAACRPSNALAPRLTARLGLASVVEAATAARIPFRPLRRPCGDLPSGAPQRDLNLSARRCPMSRPRPERPGAGAPSPAGMVPRAARMIADLQRLQQAARQQREQSRSLVMSARPLEEHLIRRDRQWRPSSRIKLLQLYEREQFSPDGDNAAIRCGAISSGIALAPRRA
jgi:hypothetical protein